MSPRSILARLNRLQRERRFMIVASVLIVVLTIVALGAWLVLLNAPDTAGAVRESVESAAGAVEAQAEQADAVRGATDPGAVRRLLGAANPALLGVVLIAAAGAIALIVTWLGLLLTYLALAAGAAAVAVPLALAPVTRDWGILLLGAIALTAAFGALLQGARALLSGGTPVLAVARNVLAEAVRMKISLVFIVMLIFFLAALPFLLDADQPLRYRVQTFLQYGSGGAYWVLAFLTVFFSIATLTFEQRDRVIWQTMTKPVAPWQYVLGKWLGVVTLNLVLLLVTAAGVFLFTEHLRRQPAQGEVAAYVNADDPDRPTEDRFLLETQVLTARAGRYFEPPEFDQQQLGEALEAEIQRLRSQDPNFVDTIQSRDEVRARMLVEADRQYRTIDVGDVRVFYFEGLGAAREHGLPLTLRFKVNAGTNNPSTLYRLFFVIGDSIADERQATLAAAQTIEMPSTAIDEDGRLRVEIWNGNPMTGAGNPRPIFFDRDGLEALYTAGSYEANFLRAMIVFWLKLAFIAAIAVMASTFLAFPVACLVSLASLFIAESAGYLVVSLDYYSSMTKEGLDYVAVVARAIAVPVSYGFRWYGEIRPTDSLVDGRIISWSDTVRGSALLLLFSSIALAIGWAVFRRRELATYSGR